MNSFSKISAASLMAATAMTAPASHVLAEESKKEPARINVTGTADIDVAPDMAILTMGVLRQGKTARQALDANNKAMSEVLASMKEAGVAERDLQTSNFSIQPQYQHYRPKKGEIQKPPKIVGYVVSNNLTVRVRDLDNVGEVLDRSVTLGVNSGGNIRFTNDNPKDAISIARGNAMRDAVERAKILTEAAGVSLGPIISIDENFSRPRPVPMARGKMMAQSMEADSVPIAAGENSYTVTVHVSWEIDQ